MTKRKSKTRPESVMPEGLNMQAFASPMDRIVSGSGSSPEERAAMDKMCGRTPNEFEWLGPFVLPPFQRPAVWTQSQQTRFIESIWLGYSIGNYVLYVPHDERLVKYTDALLDGQQRIRAILSYHAGEFEVFGYRFPDLPRGDQRRFLMGMIFPCAEIRETMTEDDLRDIYNRLNYGGTSHTEDQRA